MLKKLIPSMAATGVLFSLGIGHFASADVLKTREPQTTSTGDIFYPDDSHPELGNAWRDPSGMIWGDIVRESDSSGRSAMVWLGLAESREGQLSDMTFEEAKDYCESIGASLPLSYDFHRLRDYMGWAYDEYRPQILPNLDGKTFWNSGGIFGEAWYFYGGNGETDNGISASDTLSVRCVTR